MATNFVKVVACHDEFHDAIRKYKVTERDRLELGLELWFTSWLELGSGLLLCVAYII